MPLSTSGRVPPPDPMERARITLIQALDNAVGADLERAVREGGEWVHRRPWDEEVAEALAQATRRLEEAGA